MRNGSDLTIEDCLIVNVDSNKNGNSMRLENATAELINVTMTSVATSGTDGGHLLVQNGATLIADGLTVENGTADRSGGGLYVENAVVDLTNCSFRTNTSLGGGSFDGGGAIFAHQSSTVLLTDCTFESNTAVDDGGAVQVRDNSTVLAVSGSVFNANSAKSGGHLSTHAGASSVLTDSVLLLGNSLGSGGAIYLTDSGTVSVDGCTLADNTAGINGGAVATTSISGGASLYLSLIHI